MFGEAINNGIVNKKDQALFDRIDATLEAFEAVRTNGYKTPTEHLGAVAGAGAEVDVLTGSYVGEATPVEDVGSDVSVFEAV